MMKNKNKTKDKMSKTKSRHKTTKKNSEASMTSDKMTKFEKFTAKVICILEYFTEFVVGYQVYRLTGSFIMSILALAALTVGYSFSAVIFDGWKSIYDLDKAKKNVTFLQPYWLVINTILCVWLSRFN